MPPSEKIKGDSCHRQALSHESGLGIITASSQQPRGGDEDMRTPLSHQMCLCLLNTYFVPRSRKEVQPTLTRTGHATPPPATKVPVRDKRWGAIPPSLEGKVVSCPCVTDCSEDLAVSVQPAGAQRCMLGVTGSPFLEDRLAEARSKLYPSIQIPEPLGNLRLLPNN